MQRMGDIFLDPVDFLEIFDHVDHQFASFEVENTDSLVSQQNSSESAMRAEVE